MKTKKTYLILLLTLATIHLQAQDKTILVFDLLSNTLDSITNITYDTTSQSENTPYYIGDFNSTIETLEQETPVTNIFPDSEFTLKKKASLAYDLNSYPLRTSVKLFYIENGVLRNLCSGSMVSKKHVLTAAHCIAEVNTNDLLFDSLIVCPVYDYGNTNPNFGCLQVTKAFLIKDWVLSGGDFAVLELEESIGQSIGWISIGYDETGDQYVDDIFYKFTYPSIFMPNIDSTQYNGDTIYYNYGKVIPIGANFIGADNTVGIVGESGSSIIRVKNNEVYTSYGVLTFGFDLKHSKITKEIYHLLKTTIEDDISTSNVNLNKTANIIIFPNPTNEYFQIKNLPSNESVDIFISDVLGRMVYYKNDYQSTDQIDINQLANGLYHLTIVMGDTIVVKKIIKNGE